MYSTELKVADPAKLPKPSGYKLLVAMPRVQQKTSGGIHLPDKYTDAEKVASIFGKVIAKGPDAFMDEDKFPTGAYCDVGTWVVFRSYSGTRLKIDDQEYRLINDDTVEAVVDDPEHIARAY